MTEPSFGELGARGVGRPSAAGPVTAGLRGVLRKSPFAAFLAGLLLAGGASSASAATACPVRVYTLGPVHPLTATTGTLCRTAARTLSDWELLPSYSGLYFRPGLHRFTLARTGPHYQQGEDWRCIVRVVKRYDHREQHPIGKAHGNCSYLPMPTARFTFGGIYA